MMLIRFTAQDVTRVRLTPGLGPIGEAVQAIGAMLRTPGRRWERKALAAQTDSELRLARYLRPMATVGVDLITLGPLASGRADAITVLHDAHPHRLATELRMFPRDRVARPDWLRAAESGVKRGQRQLLSELIGWHDKYLAQNWPRVREDLEAEHASRLRTLGQSGIGGFLTMLGHGITWDGQVLRIPDAARWAREPVEVCLNGRGLIIAGSRFAAVPEPYFPIDPDESAVLVVPMRPPQDGGQGDARDARRVASALGGTRARVLATLAQQPLSTSALAQTVGIAQSSASAHAAALRHSGLVTTWREGRSVRHQASDLGRRVIAAENQSEVR